MLKKRESKSLALPLVRRIISMMLCITTITLIGCGEADYSATASEMLKCISEEVIERGGIEAQVSIKTINISDFKHFPVEEYISWVKEKYNSDDCIVLVSAEGVFPFENNSDVYEYLQKLGYKDDVTWDWTNICFSRENRKKTLSKTENIITHFSYRSINEIEGWKAEVIYKNNQWTIKNANSTYMS